MALYGDLTYDSRIRREARALAEAGYDVVIVCLAVQGRPTDFPEAVTVRVQPAPRYAIIPGSTNPFFETRNGRAAALRGRVRWLTSYVRGLRAWGRLAVRAAGPVQIWHAHDLTGLAAISPNLPDDIPLVYDSHEHLVETVSALRLPAPARRLLRAYERRLISRASAVVTVNQAVASVLRRRYRPARMIAVHNCPDLWEVPVERPDRLRAAAGISEQSPVILYHGALSANRGIEQLMEAILQRGLEGTHLVLMGSGEKRDDYLRASSGSAWSSRVHVLDPVVPTELLHWVASADVGAMPLQPATLNLRLSTPNKLFECLAAGTPLIASDFPALREIIVGNPVGPLGAVCDPENVEAVADALRSILTLERADMVALRARCSLAAAERWNWGRESEGLARLYADLVPAARPESPASAGLEAVSPADDIHRGREETMVVGREAAPAAGVNTPRVSIGMPVRNGEEFIRQGIESLLGQSMGDVELIISDNASSDGTQAICEEYAGRDKRIRYYRNDRNIGLQANFVRVLDLATAPYFMWGCHDDQWDPSYIAKMVDVLDSRGSVVLAGSNSASIDQNGVHRRHYDNVSIYGAGTTAARAHRFICVRPGGGNAWLIYGLMRTPIIQEIGYGPLRKTLDTNRGYYAVDNLALFRLIFRGSFYVADETLYFHRDVVVARSGGRRWAAVRSPGLERIPALAKAARNAHQYYGDLRRILRDSDLDGRQEAALLRATIGQELRFYAAFARSLLARRIPRHF